MKTYYVDRIEEEIAVCEDQEGEFYDIELVKLPAEIREGSVIRQISEKEFIIDESEEQLRRRANFELMKKVFEDEQQ